MKILVVSLLRIGDVLSTLPALKKLRTENPKSQIDLLMNSNFAHMTDIISHVDRVLLFDRDGLQRSLVDADRPIFDAYDQLNSFIEDLNANGYDRIINFTHNRLSGWLCGLIQANEKQGLVLDGTGAVSFGDPWFHFLNSQVDVDAGHPVNHADIFLGAVSGWTEGPRQSTFDSLLTETERGRREAAVFLGHALSGGPRIALQLSTSDVKKEWGDDRYRSLVHSLGARFQKLTVFVLGAPNEARRISAFCESLRATDGAHQIVALPTVISLEGAVTLMEECDLLVTGDTSIKHLAAASSVPVIEIALGSADVFRTGSWKEGDVIVSSKEPCAPCGHSENCHRASHMCAAGVSVEAIAEMVRLRLDEAGLFSEEAREVLRPFESRTAFYLVDRSEGPCHPLPILADLTDEALANILDRSARCISVELKSGRFGDLDFGTAVQRVSKVLSRQFGSTSEIELRHALAANERELMRADGLIGSLKVQVLRAKESYQNPIQLRDVVRSCMGAYRRFRQVPILGFASEALAGIIEDDRSAPFTRLRKIVDALEEIERRQAIMIKLCRGIEGHSTFNSEIEKT